MLRPKVKKRLLCRMRSPPHSNYEVVLLDKATRLSNVEQVCVELRHECSAFRPAIDIMKSMETESTN